MVYEFNRAGKDSRGQMLVNTLIDLPARRDGVKIGVLLLFFFVFLRKYVLIRK